MAGETDGATLIKRITISALLSLAVIYGGDYLIFRIRRSPTGTVTVRRYYAIQKKANRVEYVFDKELNQTCVQSLFPHLGDTPCWYLSRHSELRIDI
jgi:hypothetical protein